MDFEMAPPMEIISGNSVPKVVISVEPPIPNSKFPTRGSNIWSLVNLVPRNKISSEPQRIELKRKFSLMPVGSYERNRRDRINSNEQSAEGRPQELLKLFDAFDAAAPSRKKQKLCTFPKAPKLVAREPREPVMRTKIVPMLPCDGYTLPPYKPGLRNMVSREEEGKEGSEDINPADVGDDDEYDHLDGDAYDDNWEDTSVGITDEDLADGEVEPKEI